MSPQWTPDPRRAAFLSAAIPGLGQLYNRQYWKIPIIYGTGLALVHYARRYNELYYLFRNAEIAINDDRPDTINPFDKNFPQGVSVEAVKRGREALRRRRDHLLIWIGLVYVINIVEANVASHLIKFNRVKGNFNTLDSDPVVTTVEFKVMFPLKL